MKLTIATLLTLPMVALALLTRLLDWSALPPIPTFLLFVAIVCTSNWIAVHSQWRGPLSAAEQVFFGRVWPRLVRINRALAGASVDLAVPDAADDLDIDLDLAIGAESSGAHATHATMRATMALAVYLGSRGLEVASLRSVLLRPVPFARPIQTVRHACLQVGVGGDNLGFLVMLTLALDAAPDRDQLAPYHRPQVCPASVSAFSRRSVIGVEHADSCSHLERPFVRVWRDCDRRDPIRWRNQAPDRMFQCDYARQCACSAASSQVSRPDPRRDAVHLCCFAPVQGRLFRFIGESARAGRQWPPPGAAPHG